MQATQQIKDCATFLGELTHLGAVLANLRTVEEAYWELLKKPTPTPYDKASPFRYNGMPDFERVAPMLQDLGASSLCEDATDCFWELVWWAGASNLSNARDDDARIKAAQMSVAALWDVAVVVTLALRSGVYESNKKALIALVVEVAP